MTQHHRNLTYKKLGILAEYILEQAQNEKLFMYTERMLLKLITYALATNKLM